MNQLRGYLNLLMAMGFRGIFKTLYLNFRMLPFAEAIRLPVYCTAYTKFYSLRGKIVFECPVRHGLVKIGFLAHNMFVPSNNITLLEIDGEFRVGGRGDFAPGVSISIAKNAILRIGKEFFINSRVKIVCHEKIQIGDWARIAWESQIFDTNFHYIVDQKTGEICKKTRHVYIGNSVWLGNRTTVTSGTIIPEFCIVASNSVCTKNYSEIPPDSIIGGMPAKLIKTGYRRIYSYEEEAEISSKMIRNMQN